MRIIAAESSRSAVGGFLMVLLLALPGVARASQGSATAPRARGDGWKPKVTDRAADGAVLPEAPPAASNDAPKTDAPKTDAARSDAPKSPSGSPATRLLPSGGGQTTLAAEKAAIDKVSAKTTIEEILSVTLPPRSDSSADWSAGPEPLHRCCEPRWIEPCIPLPPCHPSLPPHPFDLVGVAGEPTDGPIYRGPCCPRTGSHDDGAWSHLHRVHDRFFDAFYRTK